MEVGHSSQRPGKEEGAGGLLATGAGIGGILTLCRGPCLGRTPSPQPREGDGVRKASG